MDLVVVLLAVILLAVGSFWLLGFIYGLLRPNPIFFPLSLAAKMAAASVLGVFLFGVGGIILATLVFNGEMSKRDDHRLWSTIVIGALISTVCTAVIYVSAFTLAWEIIG